MITFVDYQYKGIGGVGQIIINTTLELNKRGKRTKIYCSSESYEYQRLKDYNASFDYIDSSIVPLVRLKDYISSDDVIVLTNINDTPLLENIKAINNRLMFYSVHPDTFWCYPKYLDIICDQNKAALKLVRCLDEHNSLCFMDWPNVKAIYERCEMEFRHLSYLPVPVMSYSKSLKGNTKISKRLNITYLGRGNDTWKIYPVIKVIEDLISSNIKASITILTDIDSQFRKMIGDLLPNNNINVDYILNLYGKDLDHFLIEHSDLHIAMGTSALEGAKLGIPTVLVDYSKEKFPKEYKYRWLYECEDYCLGGEIKNGQLPYNNGRSLSEIIQSISTDEGYRNESEACRMYLEKNHSIQSFVDRLEDACSKTTMTTKDYCNTRFSKNMYYILPLIVIAAKIKNFIIR